jgi:PAS domain S-box-containing protein
VHTQYLSIDGEFVANLVIPARDGPGGIVAQGKTLVVPSGLTKRFPEMSKLVKRSDAYAGTPLFSAKGEVLGIMVVVGRRAWDAPDYVEAVIELFARRAAAEIERLAIEKEADAARHRMAEVLAALDVAQDAIVLTDDERHIIYTNESAIRLLGLPSSQSELLGKRLRDFQHDQGIVAGLSDFMDQLLRDGEVHFTTPWNRPSDGQKMMFDVHMHRLPNRGFVIIGSDAAPRLKLEREQRERQEREAQASKLELLGNLAGGIAHDFNNLLGAILGFGQFLVKDLDPASDQHRYASRIVGASQRGRSLIQQILSFSRRSSVEPTQIKIADSVTETEELLRATLPPSTRIVIANRVEDAAVLGDKAQLLQVLVNLCVNANDALDGDEGAITLAIEAVDRSREDIRRLQDATGAGLQGILNWTDDEGYAHIAAGALPAGACIAISVRDSGKGIPEEVRRRIFDPFVTTKGKGRGTGLGLAVVHRIVLERGGAILVRTKENVGTEFEILLPSVQALPAPGKAERKARGAQPADQPAQGARILVVDDDEAFCAMVETALTRLNYEVEATKDPRVAVAWLKHRSSHWDILVTDQSMPHIKGQDLIRTFKARLPETKCIMCTGYSSGLDERKAKKHGADAFLLKPFDVDVLANVVERLVGKHKKARPAPRAKAQ